MTDTPDALIKEFKESLFDFWANGIAPDTEMLRSMCTEAENALRARLTASDAAIKRVAELEAAYATLAADRNTLDADYCREMCRADKAEADFAAARAEIERKDAAKQELLDVIQNAIDHPHDGIAYLREWMDGGEPALAPKETNNG
jgi:hypothetical protein